jgi:hypothetical protein
VASGVLDNAGANSWESAVTPLTLSIECLSFHPNSSWTRADFLGAGNFAAILQVLFLSQFESLAGFLERPWRNYMGELLTPTHLLVPVIF